ncbi:MAG: hypothetical protein WKG32_23340 [Gemmatimonadaceae bacterium]
MTAHVPGRVLASGLTSGLLVAAALGMPWGSTAAAQTAGLLPGRVVDIRAGEFFFQAPDTIPAGLTTFRLLQVGLVADRLRAGAQGRALVADKGDDTRGAHMLWVVRLEDGKTVADLYRAAQAGERMPPWARQMGGPGFNLPPRTTNATLDLEPGSYALVCYIGSAREDRSRYHLLHGMFRPLTVMPPTGRRVAAPRPHVLARITGDGIVQFSAPIAAGRRVIRVENVTDKDYEFKFQRIPPGRTGKDFLAQPPSAGPGTPWGGLASVPPGASVTTTMDFEPGEYIVGTWPAIRHQTSQVVTVVARRK